MEWLEILYTIFEYCFLPLLMVLTVVAIKWLTVKEKQITSTMDNELDQKYTAMLFETVRDCVSATTQTYVSTLKAEGKFDAEAQKIAFTKTFDAVMAILTDEAKEYLTNIYGDLEIYLTAKIEAEVKAQK